MSVAESSATAYKRYVLGTLTLVNTWSLLDRGLIILLLQPIKEDLHLSDTQLGFLTGIAFGLFYATLGVPIARWADRGNRTTIASMAIALWGGTVMLCWWVGNFVQLVAARIAAAVGEAGCTPPTYSLVGDYFPVSTERARAMAIYWLASPLASLISFMAGGWINQRLGWRATFFVAGLPAILVAVLVKLTITEPRVREYIERPPSQRLSRITDVLSVLWRQPSTRHLSLAIILLFTMGLGLAPWYAAFLIRSHGMNTVELGVWFGFIFGLGGTGGILLGSYIVGRWFANNERGQMRLSAVMIAGLVPCFILFLLVPGKYQALFALIPLVIIFSFFYGPTFALLQRLVADEMRATTLAVVMLLSNLIGMGLGPQVVGMLSDSFRPLFGDDSLRYAMLGVSLVVLWSAHHFWRVGETVKEDLAAVARLARPATDVVAHERGEGIPGPAVLNSARPVSRS